MGDQGYAAEVLLLPLLLLLLLRWSLFASSPCANKRWFIVVSTSFAVFFFFPCLVLALTHVSFRFLLFFFFFLWSVRPSSSPRVVMPRLSACKGGVARAVPAP